MPKVPVGSKEGPVKSIALVSGGAGFVGSYLCQTLLASDCQVICLDNLSVGKRENIEGLMKKEDFFFLKGDVNSLVFLEEILAEFPRIAYVFHLAGIEEHLAGQELSLSTLRTNAQGTENLLKLSQKEKAKFLLVSSLEVFSGVVPINSLADYESRETPLDQFSFHEAKRYAEVLASQYSKSGVDARVVRIGEVYGPRMSLGTGSIMAKLLEEALGGGPIRLPGEGSGIIYPVFIEDAVEGICRAMFAPGTAGKIFNLISAEGIPLISFASALKKELGVEIEYVAPISTLEKRGVEGDLSLGWKTKISLEEGIKKTIEWFQQKRELGLKEELAEKLPQRRIALKIPKLKISFIPLTIVLCLFLLFLFGFSLYSTVSAFKKIQTSFGRGDFISLRRESLKVKKVALLSRKFFLISKPIFSLINNQKFEKAERTFSLILRLDEVVYHSSLAAEGGVEIFKLLLAGEDTSLITSLPKIKGELKQALEEASLVQLELQGFSGNEPFVGPLILKIKKFLPEARQTLFKAQETIDILPSILAIEERKSYLLLFQNNAELRPTGGFIGSFGILTFEKGRLLDFEIEDVYAADGQLKGHVDPPPKLGEFLGQAGWYLRDSNWDPDFPSSAVRASWFLEKEIGKRVDGVIGIDLFVAQKLLEATGEIYLADYDEKINANNFFERATYHSEVGFFPGSTGKKDFLGAVVGALFEEIKSAKGEEFGKIASSLQKSLEEKDILLFFFDEQIMAKISQFGWDGGLKDIECQEETECLTDYLAIVEANVGINKANYFLERSLEQQVNINEQGEIKSHLKILYQNKSPNDVFPAGRYKNYLRIYVPEGSRLDECKIDAGECKIDQTIEHQRTVFGFLVEVPVGEKREVKIAWSPPFKVETGSYLFFIQKQPGTKNDSLTLSFSFPPSFSVLAKTADALTGEGLVIYNTALSKDSVFEIELHQ